jgi:hypothetical protein
MRTVRTYKERYPWIWFFHPLFQKTLLHLLDLAIGNYAIAEISYLTPSV